MTDKQHTILLVDDEENILNSIYRLLRRERKYEVLMANSGAAGLEILKERCGEAEKRRSGDKDLLSDSPTPRFSVSLIVSDQRMPQMEGVEFLSRAKEISPDTTRVMLTGYADINAVTAAVNKGEIFRYITKPWEDETLLSVIKQGIEQYELVTERKELLELTSRQNEALTDLNRNLEQKVEERTNEVQELYKKLKTNFYETIRVFVSLVEHYDNHLGGHIKRVATLAEEFAEELGLSEKEIEEIEVAALLHDIGLVGIPKVILAKEMQDLSFNELNLMKQHPAFGQSLLHSIESLHQAGVIIRGHHERHDGTGYPDGLKGEEIPYASRVLALCDTYDDNLNKRVKDKGSEAAALYHIKSGRGILFEPEMANAFLKFIGNRKQAGGFVEKEITLSQLQEGMVISRDISTSSGRLLMPKGAILSQAIIERLRNFHTLDPILDNIFVKG